MPRYRRATIDGGTFFFTVTLADRSSDLLVKRLGRFRDVYRSVQKSRPFETVAICILRSKVAQREKGIWQRRYWEHVIRDDADLSRHVDYIHFNPVKHGLVSRVCDWPNSSFHRYVKGGLLSIDWGGDSHDIVGLFGE